MKDKAPHCKKCGKVLRDPVSIACGMGPCCRGETRSTRRPATRQGKHAGTAYDSQARAVARGHAITSGAAFDCGFDPKTHQPVHYTPDGAGRYIDSSTGKSLPAATILSWGIRYGLIVTTSVHPIPASAAYLSEAPLDGNPTR